MKQEIIAIYVSGGVVQEVRTNAKNPPVIRLFDADNLEETKTRKQIEAKWNRIVKQCPEELPIVA